MQPSHRSTVYCPTLGDDRATATAGETSATCGMSHTVMMFSILAIGGTVTALVTAA